MAELGLVPGQVRRFARVQVDGVWGQAWIKAVTADAFVFLFATDSLNHLEARYAQQWTIEQCFQNLKGRGFNMEATSLRCFHKLRKSWPSSAWPTPFAWAWAPSPTAAASPSPAKTTVAPPPA